MDCQTLRMRIVQAGQTQTIARLDEDEEDHLVDCRDCIGWFIRTFCPVVVFNKINDAFDDDDPVRECLGCRIGMLGRDPEMRRFPWFLHVQHCPRCQTAIAGAEAMLHLSGIGGLTWSYRVDRFLHYADDLKTADRTWFKSGMDLLDLQIQLILE